MVVSYSSLELISQCFGQSKREDNSVIESERLLRVAAALSRAESHLVWVLLLRRDVFVSDNTPSVLY